MKRGKSLPLARVSGRKFRFECRRDAKREEEKIVEKESISRYRFRAWKKSSKRKILFKACFSPLSLSLSRVRFRAPRAKSEGLAGYGSRLLRC